MADFNAEPPDTVVSDFCEICNLKIRLREKICFRNPSNPSCIDLIITNRSKSFQNSLDTETGLPYFYKMCITVKFVLHLRKNDILKLIKHPI